MKRSLLLAAAAVFAVYPVTAEAQLTSMPAANEYFNFVSASGSVTSQGYNQNVRVGPYTGSFASVSGNFPIFCVDYLHWASNTTGSVNVYGVGGDLGNVSTTRFDDPLRYRRAAYLASMFETYAGASNRRFMWSALHAAIWQTTSGVDVVASGQIALDDQRDTFFQMAQTNVTASGGFSGNGWYVISSEELAASGYANGNYDGTGQEFLVQRVPEPGTMLLMLTGFVMLVGVSRKRIVDTYS